VSRDDLPKLGSWHWCRFNHDDEKPIEELCCVTHIGSNFVRTEFYTGSDRHTSGHLWKFDEWLENTRPEPNWRQIMQQRSNDTQRELQAAVQKLVQDCQSAHLVASQNESPIETLALTTSRTSPEEMKSKLIALKNETFPQGEKRVEALTQRLVGIQKSFCLAERAQVDKMNKALSIVDERLFALELYAGLIESVKQIRDGKPADAETPIAIRQMLRYMDEETLIEFDKGGLDFANLEQFDEWVARDENLNRIAPEPRCIVALKVRRNDKDYGFARSIGEAFAHAEWNEHNKKTYLLLRNGDRVFRLESEQEFKPRLIPFEEELSQPFEREKWFSRSSSYKPEVVTPQDFEFDEKVEERRKLMMQYNRIVFLVQGLLDRSKVFSPHPHISLADSDHLAKYFKLVRDEEKVLPSTHTPEWEKYRDDKNKAVRVGCFVYRDEPEEESGRYSRDRNRPKYGYDAARRPHICQVSRVSKDRKTVTLRWSLGNKTKERWVIDMTRPVPNKPNYYYRKMLTDDLGERFGVQRVEMNQVFAVQAYRPGDYKQFLCDAYQKGRYLRWAPALLNAERWHMERVKQEQIK